jgi:glycolate oxidase iron-sulfur subunit
MEGLFAHVHDATTRTLTVNAYDVREASGQVCCGALHAHAGLIEEARGLARRNLVAFRRDGFVVVNSAGCGAQLRDYGHLLPDDPDAAAFSARVRDISELLAEGGGPVAGAPLPYRVAYDAACHLHHAQRVTDPPFAVLRAIPGLDWRETPDSTQCCGSAGLFTLVQPELSQAVLRAKLEKLADDPPDVLATGNPGCLMQLGAGARAAGLRTVARHPVELLDESYAGAGHYA